MRESLAESPLRELLLARWCDEKKLADEGRFHWLNVLRIEPLNQEALKALGVQWYNGLLLTRDQVAEQKRKDFKASRDTLNPMPHASAGGNRRLRAGNSLRAGATAICWRRWKRIWRQRSRGMPFVMVNTLLGQRSRTQGSGSVPGSECELGLPPGERPGQHEVRGHAGDWPSCGGSPDGGRGRAEEATPRGLRPLAAGVCALPRGVRLFRACLGRPGSERSTPWTSKDWRRMRRLIMRIR